MRFNRTLLLAVCSFALVAQGQVENTNKALVQADTITNQPAADEHLAEADKAWKELQKAFRPPMVPTEWQLRQPTAVEFEAFRAERARLAGEALNAAREFWTRYPDHPKAAEAKKKAEGLRFAVLMEAAQHAFKAETPAERMSKAPEQEKAARDLVKDFPDRREGYDFLFFVANETGGEKAKELIKEILASPAPEELKSQARGMAWNLDAIGKELSLAFSAVDGRNVDLTRLRGKVVLVDFWATWCVPCVGEMPNVKMAYEKLHDKGFEIVSISLDTDKGKLIRFLETNEIKWPQYYEGKSWDNQYAVQFGIHAIPAMWLVDKKGKLRDMDARGGLDEKVEKLLAE